MREHRLEQESLVKAHPLAIWYQLGSICFVAALATMSFQCAPVYAPFLGVAVLGYALISLFHKMGLVLALSAQVVLVSWYFFSSMRNLWLDLFLVVLGLSWFLIYAQKMRWTQWILSSERAVKESRLQLHALDQKNAQDQAIAQDQQIQLNQEIRRLNQAQDQLIRDNRALSLALQEKERLCCQLQGKLYADTSFESSVDEDLQKVQLHREYQALQTRFEEKMEELALFKRTLFQTEGALHQLKQQWEEACCTMSEEDRLLQQQWIDSQQENDLLHMHLDSLYELTSLLIPFAKTKCKK